MKKGLLTALFAISCVLNFSCDDATKRKEFIVPETRDGKETNEYDGPAERDRFEFDRIKDPALGYVPMKKMAKAVEYTENLKAYNRTHRTEGALIWTERGPIYDLVGPSGNSRGGVTNYTSGRTRAILIDTLNDPTGNTVFCGAVAGGLWRCTNFLSAIPNWQFVDDHFNNLAISSICQDPSDKQVMYFSTGEANSNVDAVYGGGVWRSTNGGTTWANLASSVGFIRVFKIVCDAAGNLFLANRFSTTPDASTSGLYRLKKNAAAWEDITPSGLTSGNPICTDIEISSTGRLHASFGFSAALVQHLYANNPSTVTSLAGWNTSSGIRINNAVPANRLELAVSGNILYAVTTNGANNVDSCYKSVNGGATWTLQNAVVYTTGVSNTQGWYNITLAINPANTSQIIVGGLDAYKSIDNGATIAKITNWVTNLPYVHADHHFLQWWNVGAQSRIVIGCDGGVFYSNDGGATFADKNRNLAIKQFYSGTMDPGDGTNYFLAGAQDNGVHQLTSPGLSFSTEVTGGDGCFVHINQQDAQIQFGSYVYNQYNKSTDGGATWAFVGISAANGLFVNPFDYDDMQNIMYASWGVSAAPNNQILRWTNANASGNTDILTLSALASGGVNGNATAFKVSPNTPDVVYVGSDRGKLVRLDNASSASPANADASASDISGINFPAAYMSCINTGSSDSKLIAVFSNYGLTGKRIWISDNGGGTWTNIDGGLPDMPIRWAVFDPNDDNKVFIATEAGVYYTDAVNGGGTVWTADPGFPTVRTDMLTIRASDNLLLAATHGRGLWTAPIPITPKITFSIPYITTAESPGVTSGCRIFKDYTVYVSILAAPTGDATVDYSAFYNTALEGLDFDFTTNGDFASPSKQHIFKSGVKDTKAITVRIYDDAEVEPTETFTLGFVISGPTDAVYGRNELCRFTILDNDFLPSANATLNGSIGSSNTNLSQPFRGQFTDSRTQVLYLASELTAAGLSAGLITSISLSVTAKNSTVPFSGFTVKLKNTQTGLMQTGNPFETGATIVYGPVNYSTVAGNNVFALTTPFVWDGTSNLLVEYCYHNAAKDQTDNVAGTSGIDRCRFDRQDNTVGCTLPNENFNFTGSARPDISLAMTTGTPPATKVGSTKTLPFAPSSDFYFYTAKREVLAGIHNFSGHDFGCTQVSIDREGTSAVAFWDNIAAHYIMSKTYLVTPTTNNTGAAYQITLYFTPAEKAGWEALTHNNWFNIKIIKTQGPISNVTPTNTNGAGAMQVVTPSYGNLGPNYTLSFVFSNGFSGFGAGIPGSAPGALPITLIDFQGHLDNNTAMLSWSTSLETNSKNFDVEKSTDGTTFYKIGSVGAAGNSSVKKDYAFRDQQLSPVNFYRLRLNENDGRFKISSIVLINFSSAVQNVSVVNNPFTDYLDVRLAKHGASATLQLISASGAILAQKHVSNPSGQLHWSLPVNVSAGSYVLRTVVDGTIFINKLMKQ